MLMRMTRAMTRMMKRMMNEKRRRRKKRGRMASLHNTKPCCVPSHVLSADLGDLHDASKTLGWLIHVLALETGRSFG